MRPKTINNRDDDEDGEDGDGNDDDDNGDFVISFNSFTDSRRDW